MVNFYDLWRNRDEIFENGQYRTTRIGEEASGFIAGRRGQPFFLYTAFNAVRYPMHVPPKILERFPGGAPELRERASHANL